MNNILMEDMLSVDMSEEFEDRKTEDGGATDAGQQTLQLSELKGGDVELHDATDEILEIVPEEDSLSSPVSPLKQWWLVHFSLI